EWGALSKWHRTRSFNHHRVERQAIHRPPARAVPQPFGRRTRRVTENVRAGGKSDGNRREKDGPARAVRRYRPLQTGDPVPGSRTRQGAGSGGLLRSFAPAGTRRALGTVTAGSGGHVLRRGRPTERTEGTCGSESGGRIAALSSSGVGPFFRFTRTEGR